MASVTIRLSDGRMAQMTTDHAASSYGQPMLVFNGAAYASGDRIPDCYNRLAEFVAASALTNWEEANPALDMSGMSESTPDVETALWHTMRAQFYGTALVLPKIQA